MATTALEREKTETDVESVDELFSLTEADLAELRNALQEVAVVARPGASRKTQMVVTYSR